jgi:hypothetical protein
MSGVTSALTTTPLPGYLESGRWSGSGCMRNMGNDMGIGAERSGSCCTTRHARIRPRHGWKVSLQTCHAAGARLAGRARAFGCASQRTNMSIEAAQHGSHRLDAIARLSHSREARNDEAAQRGSHWLDATAQTPDSAPLRACQGWARAVAWAGPTCSTCYNSKWVYRQGRHL